MRGAATTWAGCVAELEWPNIQDSAVLRPHLATATAAGAAAAQVRKIASQRE